MKQNKVLRHNLNKKRKPIFLSWDLETGANIVTAHSLFNDRGLPTSAIQQEKYIICGSWKRWGEHKVHHAIVTQSDPLNDRAVVHKIYRALCKADAIIAHYGDAFDVRTFNARAIYHGLPPLPPIVQIDTWKLARSKFKFNSNRLDYVGEYLGLGRKKATTADLWDKCREGDAKGLRKMLAYNIQDVRLLEKVFLKLYPYCTAKIDLQALTGVFGCGHCGSTALEYKGDAPVRTRFYKWYQCTKCQAWRRGEIIKVKHAKKY